MRALLLDAWILHHGATLRADARLAMVGAICDFFFVDERQMVAVEMVQPFVPGDGPKSCRGWKIEADSDAAVRHMNRGGTRSRFIDAKPRSCVAMAISLE